MRGDWPGRPPSAIVPAPPEKHPAARLPPNQSRQASGSTWPESAATLHGTAYLCFQTPELGQFPSLAKFKLPPIKLNDFRLIAGRGTWQALVAMRYDLRSAPQEYLFLRRQKIVK